jgi:hypothetical protein
MNIISKHPMTLLTKKDIIDDKTISWIIKTELLEIPIVYEIIVDVNKIFTHNSDEVKYMRKYNRENIGISKYIFNLHSNKVFFAILREKQEISTENNPYDDDSLNYNYGRR